MTEYSSFNIVYRLQRWMDSVPGQTFLNYAYSWGASIVILGTLFKLTHLPGANFMLYLGMGTEVLVFFLSAFDRPFDKTAEGRPLPTHLEEDEVQASDANTASTVDPSLVGTPGVATVAFSGGVAPAASASGAHSFSTSSEELSSADFGQSVPAGSVSTTASAQPSSLGTAPCFVPQMSPEAAEQLNEAQGNYVEQLRTLVDTLAKVNEQSTRLTRDSEEMENLNRTLTGITKIYEMQLKGASQQVGTIDQINEQTRRMAQQIEQLNAIYARMIEAMTVNMRAAQGPVGTSD